MQFVCFVLDIDWLIIYSKGEITYKRVAHVALLFSLLYCYLKQL